MRRRTLRTTCTCTCLVVVGILGVGISMTVLLSDSARAADLAGQQRKEERKKRTLQTLYASDRSASYEVIAQYELSSKPESVLSVNVRHTITSVAIRVLEHPLGYNNYRLLYRQEFPGEKSIVTTLERPLWDNKYVASRGCVLPSGRLFLTRRNELMFVLYDGADCTLHRIDLAKHGTEVVDPVSDELRKELGVLFANSFAPDDVYWCYCLTTCSTFFGKQCEKVEFKKLVDTKRLFAIWKRACE